MSDQNSDSDHVNPKGSNSQDASPYKTPKTKVVEQPHTDVAAITKEERNWAICVHLASLLGFIIPVVGSIVGPLVVWLTQKDNSDFVDTHGREALNFQISMMIYFLISLVLLFILIGFLFIWLIPIVDVIFVVIAAIKASEGKEYRYPMIIRFF